MPAIQTTQIEEVSYPFPFINSLPNTSSKIRHLKSNNYETKEIAKILNIRYQHVRNVLNQILKKAS